MSPDSIYRYRYGLILLIIVTSLSISIAGLLVNGASLRPVEDHKAEEYPGFIEISGIIKRRGTTLASTGGSRTGRLLGNKPYPLEKTVVVSPTNSSITQRPILSHEEMRYYLTFFPLISLIVIVTIACCSTRKRSGVQHEPFVPAIYQIPQAQSTKNITMNMNHSHQRRRSEAFEGNVKFTVSPPKVEVETKLGAILPRKEMYPRCSDEDSSSVMSDDYPTTAYLDGYLADDDFRGRSQPFRRLRSYTSNDSFDSSDDEIRFKKEVDDGKAIASMNPFHPLYAHAAIAPNRPVEDILEELPQEPGGNSNRLIVNNAMESIAQSKVP